MQKFIYLFLSISIFVQSQNSISVENWIFQPSETDFEKPLVLIDYWATWCIPCIQVMPETKKLLEPFQEDVLLIYLSDEPSLTVQKFMEKSGKEFFSASDTKSRSTSLYNINSIPSSMLLDPEGNVIWKGSPFELNASNLEKWVKKYKSQVGLKSRIATDPKQETIAATYEKYSSNKNDLNFRESESRSYYLENLAPHFYFNGNLVDLMAFIYNIPNKNVSNISSNTKYYTIETNFKNIDNLRKAIESFVKKELDVSIDKDMKPINAYVLQPSNNMNFFDDKMYDFSKNQANYLASDADVEIDNQSVAGMVSILNKFSDSYFSSKDFDDKLYDWNVHFKYNQLTLEQLKNDYKFVIEEDKILMPVITLTDR